MDNIFAQLQTVVDRYDELNQMLADPEVMNDSQNYMALSKEAGGLRETVEKFKEYERVVQEIADAQELLADDEMADLAKEDLAQLRPKKETLEETLKVLMLPKDPNDDKNIIMEIRGAAGGDESSLFAGDLLNMYRRYAEGQNWSVEIVDESTTEVGGYKEVVLMISGTQVFSKLKFESGAHRVQRIPATETQGRVHTSTATVGVMPEFEEVEMDGLIDPKDVREDVYRSSGAGGQHVNKTSSAIRLTHEPTGITVAMQDERSQQQNRARAWKILNARVYDHFAQQNEAQYAAQRKNAVGSGDRSERIRTYNYPQNRVTDHRIGLTLNKLDRIMNGELADIIDALVLAEQTAKLAALNQ
ncbi:peptide chain release factor 1 [Convivina praedatoris]|uniref:Peptide chain release factor 1 n=1 Tax=Convivina praedatoris TaxID=2880963 RepID=A0ABM9D237_9LACO|nr:peptide chain release factor 1 [Convivina sp. LMG 32447]CAH1852347.1 Peptide chain release factor 1 [Convivina sp. LMG 32447]CAH1852390.1 Peptide chain release factor 1 [Convivina sp. LMG 32447]CAH1855217.1 Peptide chain release factor 1 [Convivina sp. LMG 32447]